MGMGTHTMTRVGIVKNACNKQVTYSIILLEKELKEVYYQLQACHEHGMTAFLSHFRDEWNRLVQEIHTLLSELRTNITTLTR